MSRSELENINELESIESKVESTNEGSNNVFKGQGEISKNEGSNSVGSDQLSYNIYYGNYSPKRSKAFEEAKNNDKADVLESQAKSDENSDESVAKTISISKRHFKLLSRLQRGAKKLKLFLKEPKEKIYKWQRLGLSLEQWQKRSNVGIQICEPSPSKVFKKEPNPNSISSQKIAMRLAGVRVKDSTRAKVREMINAEVTA